MFLGCALYIEILQIPSVLSLNLQEGGVDIVSGINCILKCLNKLSALSKQEPLQWPTVAMVLAKISNAGTQKTYLGCVLSNYTERVQNQCIPNAKWCTEKRKKDWEKIGMIRYEATEIYFGIFGYT